MGKKIIIAIVIIIFLVAATIVGVYLVTSRESKDIRTKAAPTTAISLIPATSTKAAGDTFMLHVEINTGGTSAQGTGNQVVSADVIIKFDPTVLEAISVADGTFFSNPQVINNTIDPAGTIIYSSRVASKDDAVSGVGTLATITFKAINAGSDIVSFTELTSIYGLGEDANVLVSKNPSTITVTGGSTPSPSPTLIPTSTPTGSPTVAPIATPTQTPQTLPDTGISDPTTIGLGAGALFLILAVGILAL